MTLARRLAATVLLTALLAPVSAFASVISYALTSLGGANYRYDYTVSNTTQAAGIDEFTIFFDSALYSGLSANGLGAGWDVLTIQPDAGLPADGFIDILAVGPGLAQGSTLTGLSVSFTFLGTGTPGAQPFDIVDPQTFQALESGRTASAIVAPPNGRVPVPATLPLLALGMTVFGASRIPRGKVAEKLGELPLWAFRPTSLQRWP